MKNSIRYSIAGLTLACAAGFAQADIISSEPYALGGGRRYVQSGPPVHYQVAGFFDIFLEIEFTMTGPAHMPPSAPDKNLGSSGQDGVSVELGRPGGWGSSFQGQSSFFDVFVDFGSDGTRFFDTEMLSMDLAGVSPNGPWMIRESPTKASTGKYSIRESPTLPTLATEFHITSFFDVFTELSLDGGQTWLESEGPMHLEIAPTVPAPGVFGLLALSGAVAGRRRRS